MWWIQADLAPGTKLEESENRMMWWELMEAVKTLNWL